MRERTFKSDSGLSCVNFSSNLGELVERPKHLIQFILHIVDSPPINIYGRSCLANMSPLNSLDLTEVPEDFVDNSVKSRAAASGEWPK